MARAKSGGEAARRCALVEKEDSGVLARGVGARARAWARAVPRFGTTFPFWKLRGAFRAPPPPR